MTQKAMTHLLILYNFNDIDPRLTESLYPNKNKLSRHTKECLMDVKVSEPLKIRKRTDVLYVERRNLIGYSNIVKYQ